MFAPFLPHITEEIFQLYFKDQEKVKSIHISNWPKYDEKQVDEIAEKVGDVLIDIVTAVRKAKSDQQLSMKNPVKLLSITAEISNEEFELIKLDIEKALFVENFEFSTGKFKIDVKF